MAAYESSMDFLQFDDSDRQDTFHKMLAATGASISPLSTTASFDPSIYQKPEQSFDFFAASEASTLPPSFFSVEDPQYTGYPLYPFQEVPRAAPAFPYYSDFVQPPTLPSNYVVNDLYRGPTSPSVASSIAEGFDFASGHSSIASGASTSSSDHGSPYMAAQDWSLNAESWTGVATWEQPEVKDTCVNPSLINNTSRQSSVEAASALPTSPKHARRHSTFRVSPYPTPSATSKGHRRPPSNHSGEDYFPQTPAMSREVSTASKSAPSPERTASSNGTANNDNFCTACGKVFRDLKAHQITHMDERPEKCPIPTCEYAKKGFARKYDCQRHTLTHYKGTMVCGFCPGSGLPSEKTFNRADVFKRHLMSVHNVEQTAPNGKPKKNSGRGGSVSSSGSPRAPAFQAAYKDITGKCSTCNATFANAQQFYEHLDDCVLSKVVKPEPEGEVNARNLDSVNDLEEVQESLAAHGLLNSDGVEVNEAEMSEEEEEESEDDDDKTDPSFGTKKSKKQRKSLTGTGVAGRKVSKKALMAAGGRKRRRNLPAGWGVQPDRMVTKRRCLQVYDGSKLLCRDEMMMSSAWEVKANLAGGEAEVSDLDYWTVVRANAFHDAAKEERDAHNEH
ncbi:hypothetical protein H072_9263 [Dactylellina haptotyla CBS 200.50]|uniref:C2H2-type domain-containing protein n=1 Tax=Dactylellina haptotyla (strain CBS 200.50) TaxID=1284197 RepID=S8BD26_DACHA|nr:hypothetical protein H072_9263 [Dactylellina haptotyla CBS 200.50]